MATTNHVPGLAGIDQADLPDMRPGHVNMWDTSGRKHVVTQPNAHDAKTHLGWSTTAPIVIHSTAPPAQEEVAVAKKDKPGKKPAAQSAPPDAKEEDILSMTQEGLRRYAAEKLSLNFDAGVSHDDILEAVLAELEV